MLIDLRLARIHEVTVSISEIGCRAPKSFLDN